MKIKRYLILLIFVISTKMYASNVDKGFEALRIYNYFEAKKQFEKGLKEDSLGAYFGLSIIYFRQDNPFHNIDTAYKFILISENIFIKNVKGDTAYFEDISSWFEESKYLTKIYLDTISRLKNNIIDVIYKRTPAKNYNHFIQNYPKYYRIKQVINLRDSVEFENCKRINTYESYKNYCEKYPKSRFVSKAEELAEDRIFITSTKNKTLREYETFIRNNPKNPNLNKAWEKVYTLSFKDNTLDEFDKFVFKFPDHPNIDKIWFKIYLLYFKDFSIKELNAFNSKYRKANVPKHIRSKISRNFSSRNLEYLIFSKHEKFGICKMNGDIVIPCQYDFINNFSDNLAMIGYGDKIAYIDKDNDTIIDFKFYGGENFKNGYAIVDNGEYFGVIDKISKIIIPFKYKYISWATENTFLVIYNGKYMFLNTSGKNIFNKNFDFAENFIEDYSIVEVNKKFGVINKRGKYIIPTIYDRIERKDDLFKVYKNNVVGIIDRSGKILIDLKYEFLSDISEDLVIFAENDEYGYLNIKNGKKYLKSKYSKYPGFLSKACFKNGYAISCHKNKYGLIDKTGKNIISRSYDDIDFHSEGLIPFKKDKLWGFMNIKENLVIKENYTNAKSFKNGLSFVEKGDKWGAIDKKGKTIISFKYNHLDFLNNELIIFTMDKKLGVLDINNNLILSDNYKNIELYNENLLKIYLQNGDINYFDLKSKKFIVTH